MFLFIVIFVILLITIPAVFFIFGRQTAKNPNNIVRKHPAIGKALVWGYVAFASCFTYPIRSDPYPLDIDKAYLLLTSFGVIGLGLAAFYGPKKEKKLYPLILILTVSGMVGRYLMEYGEVSNTYNFTMVNIISYVVFVPLLTLIFYHFIVKYLKRNL